jgi:hypothetical protein
MDENSTELLREMLAQQTRQVELLRECLPSLWGRVRVGLFSLSVLMAGVAVGLAVLVLDVQRHGSAGTAAAGPARGAVRVFVPPMQPRWYYSPAPGRYRLPAPRSVLPESMPRKTVG